MNNSRELGGVEAMGLLPTDASLVIPESQPPISFWLEWWLRFLFIPIFVGMMAIAGPLPRTLNLALAGLLALCWSPLFYRLWRVQHRVKDYLTLSSRRTVLHFPKGFAGFDRLPEFLELCEAERDDLTQLFGFSLSRRLHVFVVPAPRDLEALFGRLVGGMAWLGANAVFLTADNVNRPTLRHEMGQLFSLRWSASSPPIMAEGLSTWLQETDRGRAIDAAAFQICLSARPDLKKLLDRKYFFDESHQYSCYVLSGSFTSFLIRRHGWDRYRRFYRKARPSRFESRFRKFFGLSLLEAERRWLAEVLAMATLNQRLLDDRLFNEFA